MQMRLKIIIIVYEEMSRDSAAAVWPSSPRHLMSPLNLVCTIIIIIIIETDRFWNGYIGFAGFRLFSVAPWPGYTRSIGLKLVFFLVRQCKNDHFRWSALFRPVY